MSYQTWIADALRAEGCRVNEVAGWQSRGDDDMAPRGLVVHHTASGRGRNAPSLNICIDGRPDLPGPLCHVLIGRDGICHVIAAGVANHAGRGGWKGLEGNESVLGIEAENDGVGEPWGPVLLTAFHRASAALARGRFAVEMIAGHKEWTRRKIDPAGIDMGEFRAQVARILEPKPPAPPEPTPEDDMPEAFRAMPSRKVYVFDPYTGRRRHIRSAVRLTEEQALGIVKPGPVREVSDEFAAGWPDV